VISSPKEIVYNNGWISKEHLLQAVEKYGKSEYGKYLKRVIDGKIIYR